MNIQRALIETIQQRSRLAGDVLKIDGMMGIYTRHLLNNLVAHCCDPSTSYLEVGCYRGASIMAALYGNQTAVGSARSIDNFSQFDKRGSNETAARGLIEAAKSRRTIPLDTELISGDSTDQASYSSVRHPPAVFFYDGDHSYESQRDALRIMLESLPERSQPKSLVYVVDDWNWDAVSSGCQDGLQLLREAGQLRVVEQIEIRTKAKSPHDPDNWWNGIAIFGIQL